MGLVEIDNLHRCSVAILCKMGVSKEDASIVADSVVYAHTRGKYTHGIGRMPIYVRKIQEGLMNPKTPLTVKRELACVSLLDAENGFGQVAAIRGMDVCIKKASAFGIGLVGIKDSNNFGTAGFIGEYAVKAGMISIVLANSAPAIAPTGSSKPLFGTNPVCIAFPTIDDTPPIIFDMACSNAARGKIRLAEKCGEKIPYGWALDCDGNDTDDPAKALKGTMIPIGGYKGYGIAMCVDLLAGMLTGSAFGGEAKNLNHPTGISRYGHLLIAINPQFFMNEVEYRKRMAEFISHVKACGGKAEVYLPGEQSARIAGGHRHTVDIKPNLVREMNDLAENLGLDEKERLFILQE